jgi:hypothetical protein
MLHSDLPGAGRTGDQIPILEHRTQLPHIPLVFCTYQQCERPIHYGIDDFQEFADDIWASQRSGLSLAELDYYRGIGATSIQIGVRTGNVTTIVADLAIPQKGDVFVDGASLQSDAQHGEILQQGSELWNAAGPLWPAAIGGVTNKFRGFPRKVDLVGSTWNGHFMEGSWFRATPTRFGQIYTQFEGFLDAMQCTVNSLLVPRFWDCRLLKVGSGPHGCHLT